MQVSDPFEDIETIPTSHLVFEQFKKQALEKKRTSLSLSKSRKRPSGGPATYMYSGPAKRSSEESAEMQQQVDTRILNLNACTDCF